MLKLEDLAKPSPKGHQVLIRVHAATVGRWDCEARSFTFPIWFWLPLRIAMGLRRPRWPVLGQELAGEVEAVGKDVKQFKPGDQVFASTGLGFGAHAEYKCMSRKGRDRAQAREHELRGSRRIPTGGDNALHFLRLARVQPGESVLVNGAGGNIGVIAVQIAKHYGADVTAVDSPDKLDTLRAIGADHVIDYTKEDFTRDRQGLRCHLRPGPRELVLASDRLAESERTLHPGQPQVLAADPRALDVEEKRQDGHQQVRSLETRGSPHPQRARRGRRDSRGHRSAFSLWNEPQRPMPMWTRGSGRERSS